MLSKIKNIKPNRFFLMIGIVSIVLLSPLAAYAQPQPLFPDEPIGDNVNYATFIIEFYEFAIPAGVLVATVLIMIGGVIWITSAGDQGRISKAKEFIIQPIIGVVILFGAYILLAYINPNLVNLKIPTLQEIAGIGSCITPGTGSCSDRCTTTTEKECNEQGGTPSLGSTCEEACLGQDAQTSQLTEEEEKKEDEKNSAEICKNQSAILTEENVPALPEAIWADDCSAWCGQAKSSGELTCRIDPDNSKCIDDTFGRCGKVDCRCILR